MEDGESKGLEYLYHPQMPSPVQVTAFHLLLQYDVSSHIHKLISYWEGKATWRPISQVHLFGCSMHTLKLLSMVSPTNESLLYLHTWQQQLHLPSIHCFTLAWKGNICRICGFLFHAFSSLLYLRQCLTPCRLLCQQ